MARPVTMFTGQWADLSVAELAQERLLFVTNRKPHPNPPRERGGSNFPTLYERSKGRIQISPLSIIGVKERE